jgi:hypothetical protein
VIPNTARIRIGDTKFPGWEGWLALAHPQDSTSNFSLWFPRKVSPVDQRGQATLPNLRICSLELSPRYGRVRTAKLVLAIILAAIALGGCSCGAGSDHYTLTAAQSSNGGSAVSLSQEDRHRLYSAALAASDFPLDTALFKEVCKKIGIFDSDGEANDNYMSFVQEHVAWGMKTETNQFRSEINTKERAQEYVLKHLP